MNIQHLLDESSRDHSHLCPRQILGVRMGLCGLDALNLKPNCSNKRLLIIVEMDGCFVDGINAATSCTIGHRTLSVEDYGKAAATFIDTQTNHALRIAPALDIRQRAYTYAPKEMHHYFAQMQSYQVMPDEEMFTLQEVTINVSIVQILSRPGVRVNCAVCGEEIMNEREVRQNGLTLCRACAGNSYYRVPVCIATYEMETQVIIV